MKAKLLYGLLLWSGCSVAQQIQLQDRLDMRSMEKIQELRLEKSKDRIGDSRLSGLTKERLQKSGDLEVLRAVLRDQSLTKSGLDLDRKANARLDLLKYGTTLEGKESVRRLDADFDSKLLVDIARKSSTPEIAARILDSKIRMDGTGRLVLGMGSVFSTNPSINAPDTARPGKIPLGFNGPKPEVWRSGLLFSGLLATTLPGKNQMVCSGTIVGKYWFLTAAHCLRDARSQKRFKPAEVSVFLPFQRGAETVIAMQGRLNLNMKRVSVETAEWLGDGVPEAFPESSNALTSMIRAGKDIALLRLKTSDMDALPARIENVKILKVAPPNSQVSVAGYGVTNISDDSDLTLMVAVRPRLPDGVSADSDLLTFGAPVGTSVGGICGGDSGGGLFAGRVNGISPSPKLIGVVSALLESADTSSADACVASAQGHASLLSTRNHGFVCGKVPDACIQ